MKSTKLQVKEDTVQVLFEMIGRLNRYVDLGTPSTRDLVNRSRRDIEALDDAITVLTVNNLVPGIDGLTLVEGDGRR